jgi:hypothetical protein
MSHGGSHRQLPNCEQSGLSWLGLVACNSLQAGVLNIRVASCWWRVPPAGLVSRTVTRYLQQKLKLYRSYCVTYAIKYLCNNHFCNNIMKTFVVLIQILHIISPIKTAKFKKNICKNGGLSRTPLFLTHLFQLLYYYHSKRQAEETIIHGLHATISHSKKINYESLTISESAGTRLSSSNFLFSFLSIITPAKWSSALWS